MTVFVDQTLALPRSAKNLTLPLEHPNYKDYHLLNHLMNYDVVCRAAPGRAGGFTKNIFSWISRLYFQEKFKGS